MVQRVLQDNVTNLHGRYQSSPQYYGWLWEFLNLYSLAAEKESPQAFHESVSLTLFLLLHVMGRNRDSVMGSVWSGHVARLMLQSQHASEWLLRRLLQGGLDDDEEHSVPASAGIRIGRYQYLYDFLCRCPRPRTRACLVESIEAVITRMGSTQGGWWQATVRLPALDPSVTVPTAELTRFLDGAPAYVGLVDRMLQETPSMMDHSIQFMSHWFRVFRVFAEAGAAERSFLVARDAVAYLMELVTLSGRFAVYKRLESGPVARNIRQASGAIGCVAAVIRGATPPSETQLTKISGTPSPGREGAAKKHGMLTLRGNKDKAAGAAVGAASGGSGKKNPFACKLREGEALLQLETELWEKMIGRDFVQLVCDERWGVAELLEAIEYLVWEDPNLNHYFVMLLVDGLKRCKTVDSLTGYLHCLEALLSISDSLQAQRTKSIGTVLLQLMARASKVRSKTVAGAEVSRYWQMLVTAARMSPLSHPVRKFVLSKEREVEQLYFELGLKPVKLDFTSS